MRIFLVLLAAWGVAGLAWAAPLRVVSLNVENGLGPAGSSSFEAKARLLERVGADVVALQELENDANSLDQQSLAQLRLRLGLLYEYSFPTSFHYVAILSRYPFINQIFVNGAGMARRIPLVQIDVPNTAFDPWIAALHLKAFDGDSNQFRRAVELTRLKNALISSGAAASGMPIVLLGDFNLVSASFKSFPIDPDGSLNGSVDDLPFPIDAFVDADEYFQDFNPPISKLELRSIDESTYTYPGTFSALDHIMVSAPFHASVAGSEIYDPLKETIYSSSPPRLPRPKFGDPATATFSYADYPSDHLPVFADLVLRDPLEGEGFLDTNAPALNLTVSTNLLTFVNRSVASAATDVTANDDQDPTPVVTVYPLNPTYTNAGIKKITYMARDRMGNIRTVDRTVTVAAWGTNGITHNLQWPPAMQIPVNGQGTVYAQIYIPGWTETVEQVAPNVRCWIGVNSQNSDPSGWAESSWKEASLNASQGFGTKADEYALSLSATDTGAGTFYFAARWQIDGGAYGYGGVAAGGGGGAWDGTMNTAGVLTVGSTVGTWSGNAPVTSELVGKYAIGGAASVSAAAELPVMAVEGSALSLTAIVRKDDPNLAVGAEWATDLAAGWSGEGVSSTTNGLAQPADPGLERRKYTVEKGEDARKFLRLRATLQ